MGNDMAATKTIEQPPVLTRQSLERQIGDLERRDRELLAQQLKLEAAGIVASPDDDARSKIRADAEQMLNGAPVPTMPTADRAKHLHGILRERQIIAKAIEIARLRLSKIVHDEAAEIGRDLETAWLRNVRATAGLIGQIEKLATERERLRDEWCSRTGLAVMPGCYVEGAQLVAPHSGIFKFMTTARRLQFV
jgi:CBS-domain-containing membrane protein